VIKSADICAQGFSGIEFGINFSASEETVYARDFPISFFK